MTQDGTQREGLALIKTDTLQLTSAVTSAAAIGRLEPIGVEG